ncbi:MAG: twin-arginine translocase TatA/TatE family subunit [Paludibacteraceae bacterium]|nr:twin-arginine translocase TatA/TatE family subunit [Paludibacteraceae bacterium]
MLGTTEIIIIAAIILLLFGGSQIPKLMRGIGQGVNAYKKGLAGEPDEDKKENQDKAEKGDKAEKKVKNKTEN